MVEKTLIVEPWEWSQGAAGCIRAIKEAMKVEGYDQVEVWAEQVPGAVHVHYCYPPKKHPHAVYRGRT